MFGQNRLPITQVQAARFTLDPNVIGTAANVLVAVQGSIALSGTAPDQVWRVNADEISSYDSFYPVIDVEFPILVPVAPTALDNRTWGLKIPGLGNRGRVEFVIEGTAFTARVYNSVGTLQQSTAITWNTDWTNAVVRYRIQHKGDSIVFLINETVVATYNPSGNASSGEVPIMPILLHILNLNADNMDVRAIILRSGYNG